MKTRLFYLLTVLIILLTGCDRAGSTNTNNGNNNLAENIPNQTEQNTATQEPAAPAAPLDEYQIPLPPNGYLYHAVFPGGSFDSTGAEDDITPENLQIYEENAGKSAAWVYFSNNWYNGREFPLETARWIRDKGSIPYIRLMLRSDSAQYLDEPLYTLENILNGDFDEDLLSWFSAARNFGTPLLVEYGTEVNGEWFLWNGVWNGGGEMGAYGDPTLADGPEKFRNAYRHIIQLAWDAGADNITWVFHVDDSDIPEEDWNQFENYYPGDDWIDWLGVSVYGALSPFDTECAAFGENMDTVIPRLKEMARGKPIAVLEFATDANNLNCDQLEWTRAALTGLVSNRWPDVIGFSYWNENWENDDDRENNTVLRVQDSPGLPAIFQELVGNSDNVLGTIQFSE